METSTLPLDLFESFLPEDYLNNFLQKISNDLQTLNCLLDVKYRRILANECDKIDINIDVIYAESVDIELGTNILNKTLSVALNPETHMSQTKNYFLNKLQNSQKDELLYAFNLMNVVFEYHIVNKKKIMLKNEDIELFKNGILLALRNSTKSSTFIIMGIITNYLKVIKKEDRFILKSALFEFIKESNNLEILCLSFEEFISSDLGEDNFSLIKVDSYWLLLVKSLSSGQYSLQKQAAYLLSKSISYLPLRSDIDVLPVYIKNENLNETEIIWRNYLTLLDISTEKQLHIIEPSLCMFASIKSLNFEWRLCLYKKFLKHGQNTVVYYVASFIVENETDWSNFSKLIKDLLSAINKNEYSYDSLKVFQQFGKLCTRFDNEQFNIIIETSLSIPWIPAAIWAFVKTVFSHSTTFQLYPNILEFLLRKFDEITNLFIRKACTTVVLKYIAKNYVVVSLKDFMKVSCLIARFCDKSLLDNFFSKYLGEIFNFRDEIIDNFLSSLENNCDFALLEIKMKLLRVLRVDILALIKSLENLEAIITDFLHFSLFELNCHSTDLLEKHVLSRIDNVDNENITILLKLCETFFTEKIIQKALNILLEKDFSKYNKEQICIALCIIIKQRDRQKVKLVLDMWKNLFFKNEYPKLKRSTEFFVQILLNYLTDSSNCDIVEFLDIFEIVLESESKEIVHTFENIDLFLKRFDEEKIFQFVMNCLDKFLFLYKDDILDFNVKINFLSQLFLPNFLSNTKYCKKLVQFSLELLLVANKSNCFASIISKLIASLITINSEKGSIFIPIIVELILHGILINKNEKVEYYVCQEIGSTLITEENPNFQELSARLCAFDSTLHLIEKSSNKEVIVNDFVSLLLDKYMKYFSKRYFPDSQIHLQKLRILQSLILISDHVTSQKTRLIDFIIDAFLLESHQPSIKHLMQWLLIRLGQYDNSSLITTINKTLTTVDNNRPSTVFGLIPVLYHLITKQAASEWDQYVELLLPYTMGAQFKLRIFSQVALLKLYEKAQERQYLDFLRKHIFFYKSLKQVIQASSSTLYDIDSIYGEFLDYFSPENPDCSTIFYTIPKINNVTSIEWKNLDKLNTVQMKYIKFGHKHEENVFDSKSEELIHKKINTNIQKKITPWKDVFDNPNTDQYPRDFILVLSLIEKPANLGGLSRSCEVFGIKEIVMRTSKITQDKEFKSLSMSSENWIDIQEVKTEDLKRYILNIQKKGYCVIGAEQTSESVKLDSFVFPKKTVLLLGNEKEGIPQDLIPLLDSCVEISQFGMVRSLNVHVAGAIFIWEYCKQHKL